MWFDLALAIGGCTVEELKQRMSYNEALQWFQYIRQRGLNHTDRLLATVACQINRLSGGEAEIGDFLPSLKQNNEEKEADFGSVFNILAGTA